jgi:hypothetical protein
MEETVKLTVRIPYRLHEQIKRRAQDADRSLNSMIIETLNHGLDKGITYDDAQDERAWRAIRESGLFEPLSPIWEEEIKDAPEISHEELREMLKGVPPLSKIIIEDRGPR